MLRQPSYCIFRICARLKGGLFYFCAVGLLVLVILVLLRWKCLFGTSTSKPLLANCHTRFRSVEGSTMCSRTSQWRRMPVSSRSEIVREPFLFDDEQNWSRISCGHSKNHVIGTTCLVPLNHTPPTPHLDASTKPWYDGGCSISSLTWVGLRPTSRIEVRCDA